jgi:xylan 1,4-beta-xylosidase
LRAAQPREPRRTYINPIDIDYRYNFEQINDNARRTAPGADPAIVRHKGAFYMFQTLADGYWRSTNLADWHFITPAAGRSTASSRLPPGRTARRSSSSLR